MAGVFEFPRAASSGVEWIARAGPVGKYRLPEDRQVQKELTPSRWRQ